MTVVSRIQEISTSEKARSRDRRVIMNQIESFNHLLFYTK